MNQTAGAPQRAVSGDHQSASGNGGKIIPRATYRLQLTKDFTFKHAAALASYLGKLGVSHAYLSPILKARPGSTHGYDVVDHSLLNPELGSMDDFRDLAKALRDHGVGIILDIVPNHMGIGGAENPQWLDVLRWGERSRFADWFDINWASRDPNLDGRLLVPFLGTAYAEALKEGAFRLAFDEAEGTLNVWMNDSQKLPLAPWTYADVLPVAGAGFAKLRDDPDPAQFSALADGLKQAFAETGSRTHLLSYIDTFNGPGNTARLHALIERQNWRPAHFTSAADEINYRRFFTVSDLAGIRAEHDAVFDHSHKLVFSLIEQGWVDGLRIDHIDGLYDPQAYCRKLRQRAPKPIYLIVEKILAPHELLPAAWQVDGTTGYEFAGIVTRLLSDAAAEASLTRFYTDFAGPQLPLAALERQAKHDIIDYEMAAELDGLTDRLLALARLQLDTADLTRNALRNALRHTVAAMPVYRTYVDAGGIDGPGRRNIAFAIAQSRDRAKAIDPAAFVFLETVMAGERERDRAPMLDLARRIQQYTGPVMAKGLEDTALYQYNRLIALSDVGEKPDRFSTSVAAFHDFNRTRQRTVPHGLLTTSSHDTKRGEDVRARIMALTQIPQAWAVAVREWDAILQGATTSLLDPNDRYYLFQLLLGAWPLAFETPDTIDEAALAAFRERFTAAMLKSVREARRHTNWTSPDAGYEQAVTDYIALALSKKAPAFLERFSAFAAQIAYRGAMAGLVETVLKLTVPGVPDIYQGAELWEQSMVDPDNRRQVDYGTRQTLLDARTDMAQLLLNWRDGGIKQQIIARLLRLRAQNPDVLADGAYEPLSFAQPHLCGFLRKNGDTTVLVLARLWRSSDQATLELPQELSGTLWQNALTGVTGSIAETLSAWSDGDLPLVAVTRKLQ